MTPPRLARRHFLVSIVSAVAGSVPDAPTGFDEYRFTFDNTTRRVFVRGDGPPILLLHELPGLTPDDLALAKRLADERHFRVHVPLMFWRPGGNLGLFGYLPACEFGGPFSCLDGQLRNPISGWLLGLARKVGAEEGPMGVIGMCLTGTVPLTLLRADAVQAIVLAQPTLPLKILPWNRNAIGIPDDDLAVALHIAGERKVSVYMARFEQDRISSNRSFERLQTLLANTPGVLLTHRQLAAKGAHSVFGRELHRGTAETDDAFDEMVTMINAAIRK
jgi:dienelactone hydrolase